MPDDASAFTASAILSAPDGPASAQLALWPRAMRGEVPAVLAVLRVLDQRMRLLGLQPSGRPARRNEHSWPSCHGPATVVVHPDDCRHTGCARHGSFEKLSPA